MFEIDFIGSPKDIDAILALLKHQDVVDGYGIRHETGGVFYLTTFQVSH